MRGLAALAAFIAVGVGCAGSMSARERFVRHANEICAGRGGTARATLGRLRELRVPREQAELWTRWFVEIDAAERRFVAEQHGLAGRDATGGDVLGRLVVHSGVALGVADRLGLPACARVVRSLD